MNENDTFALEGGCTCRRVRYRVTRAPWVVLPPGTPAFEMFYRRSELLSAGALERWSRLKST